MNQKITRKRKIGALNLALKLFEGHFSDWAAVTGAPLQAMFLSALYIFTRAIGAAGFLASFGVFRDFLAVANRLLDK